MFDPKICVSGAAAGRAAEEGKADALAVGHELAVQGAVVLTGATTGVPAYAAQGASRAGGEVIGFSPAHTLKEHVKKYRLPVRYHNHIFYTGYEYAGRDSLLIDLSDGVISVSGRIGSLHEFTQAFERGKVIGVLEESGGISDMYREIIERGGRGSGNIIFDNNPKRLVAQVLARIKEENAQ